MGPSQRYKSVVKKKSALKWSFRASGGGGQASQRSGKEVVERLKVWVCPHGDGHPLRSNLSL